MLFMRCGVAADEESEMSTRSKIFWLRVRNACRVNVHRAIELLLSIGAPLAQAIRYVAAVRYA